ncbi:hypothetical protein FE257_000043 [Aspergillus nanangensis]|uniref:Uncharacterized protein n=1 Tax=Aspergillus nanangensis TaxID=2582783 RepID=A0AAD4CYN1_ASPNN|nr:hypothetical protein FE257_000043 [Aspergillus nanangensis]
MALPHSRSYTLRKTDRKTTILRPVGQPDSAPPAFSIETHSMSKPNVIAFRGPPHSSAPIGDARFHSFSSSVDVTVRGQPVHMKMSQLSGSFSIESPRGQKMKWHLSQSTGSSWTLRDASGANLAQLKSHGIPGLGGEKRLDILVPCDEGLVELIVVTGLAAVTLHKQIKQAAEGGGDAVSALVGA